MVGHARQGWSGRPTGFVRWELRHPAPLLDVRVYAVGRFSAASLALFGMVVADFAMVFLVFQYEVYVLGFGALRAALGIAPPAMVMVLVVPLALMVVGRWGERVVVENGVLHGWQTAFYVVSAVLLACALGSSLLYPSAVRSSQESNAN